MTKKKSSLNWYFLLAGILILYFGAVGNQQTEQTEILMLPVELATDIISVPGRKSPIDYKFWTKEYKNQFNVLDGSISMGKHKAISNLQKGQQVKLFIAAANYEDIESEDDITIRGISLNGVDLLSQEEFIGNRNQYQLRLRIIALFTGLMLVLHGLTTLRSRTNYIIIGTFVGAFIFMWFFEIGLY